MKKQIGFTLLELMITVIIVVTLASVALPTYTESIAKSKRAEAKRTLIELSGVMARAYSENSSYRGQAAGDADTGAPQNYQTTVPGTGTAYYNLSITAATDSSYTLTATATGGMTGDKCGNFSYTNTGVKSVSKSTREICWGD